MKHLTRHVKAAPADGYASAAPAPPAAHPFSENKRVYVPDLGQKTLIIIIADGTCSEQSRERWQELHDGRVGHCDSRINSFLYYKSCI